MINFIIHYLNVNRIYRKFIFLIEFDGTGMFQQALSSSTSLHFMRICHFNRFVLISFHFFSFFCSKSKNGAAREEEEKERRKKKVIKTLIPNSKTQNSNRELIKRQVSPLRRAKRCPRKRNFAIN